MKSIFSFYLMLFALILVMGCDESSKRPPVGINTVIPTRLYTESELSKLIVPGMSVADVTNLFGVPGSVVKVSTNKTVWLYLFRFSLVPKNGLVGFSIDIKDEHVIRWAPIKGGIHSSDSVFNQQKPQQSFGEKSFGLFLVNDRMTNLVNLFDLQGSNDTSSLPPPDLKFSAKMFAGGSGGQHPEKEAVLLVLNEQDSFKLNVLTRTNLGKRLLIVCQNQVIAAPVILVPITSTQLDFMVKDASVLSGIK